MLCCLEFFPDSMTKSLCNEWGAQGIRVVGIAPGPIADTEGMRKLGKSEIVIDFESI